VALWVGGLGVLNVAFVTAVWSNKASAAFLITVSLLTWAWIFMAMRRPKITAGEPTRQPGRDSGS
jgi:hypothetical protein